MACPQRGQVAQIAADRPHVERLKPAYTPEAGCLAAARACAALDGWQRQVVRFPRRRQPVAQTRPTAAPVQPCWRCPAFSVAPDSEQRGQNPPP
jgi:hypothetical protein